MCARVCCRWALGCVVYEALHNVPAYHGDTHDDIKVRIRTAGGHSPLSRLLSPAARGFVQSLLCIESGARPTAERLLSHAWLQPAAAPWSFPGPIGGRYAEGGTTTEEEEEEEDEEDGDEDEEDDDGGHRQPAQGNRVLTAFRTQAREASSEDLSRQLAALYGSDPEAEVEQPGEDAASQHV